MSLYGFADDHIASVHFQPVDSNENNAIKELENSAVKINDWMNENKLKMNASKTEFIMFGSSRQLNKCTTDSIDIAGDKIDLSGNIRYLGAHLDQTLTFKEHVKRKCRTAMLN